MLEEVKREGELIAAQRPTPDSSYIEGTVKKVHRDGDDYFYEIAWEDGKHFGEIFYEGELDEIDLIESEATIRVAMADLIPEDVLEDWLLRPSARLHGLSPLNALETVGLKGVAYAAIDDYTDALREEESSELSENDRLDGQLGEIFSSRP